MLCTDDRRWQGRWQVNEGRVIDVVVEGDLCHVVQNTSGATLIR